MNEIQEKAIQPTEVDKCWDCKKELTLGELKNEVIDPDNGQAYILCDDCLEFIQMTTGMWEKLHEY